MPGMPRKRSVTNRGKEVTLTIADRTVQIRGRIRRQTFLGAYMIPLSLMRLIVKALLD
jgi:hypothetical protein